MNNLLGELSLNDKSGVVNFFNKLPTGIYFGEFANSQLGSPSTATYNSYFAFKILANFGKIFVMPTYSDIIYMADAQSGSWMQLN